MAQGELSDAAMKFVNELEMEMMVDMYNRCTKGVQVGVRDSLANFVTPSACCFKRAFDVEFDLTYNIKDPKEVYLGSEADKFIQEKKMHKAEERDFQKMTVACQKKCIPAKYKDPDLTKGEAVCIDRCVAKYLEVHDRIGKKLTALSQQDEATMKKMQQQAQGN
ncbi:hypothetical protein EGW08_010805 [Elysia chlorotica]|uniref:Tim10-like domain-containing protein n=1 Tax=Elysia chlorotica TaxID=188477 RepID=A0A433TIT0_ELYCH|nr:hypothetical protein EGW08_010805 [Elysia chlorotica]